MKSMVKFYTMSEIYSNSSVNMFKKVEESNFIEASASGCPAAEWIWIEETWQT